MTARELKIVLRNLATGANLDSLRMLRSPRKLATYATECLFLRRCLHSNGDLPQRGICETFGVDSQISVVVHEAAASPYWLCPIASFSTDLLAMCMLCQILRPKVVFEIGTFHGSGALHWASNAPQAEVYTLDLPPTCAPSLATTQVDKIHIQEQRNHTRLLFDHRPEASRIHCLYGDSATFDYDPFFGRVDLFFVDGAHSYEYVRNDTINALRCCHAGSVIAWHDYGRVGFNGVSRWLHEFAHGGSKIYRVPGGSLAYMRVADRDGGCTLVPRLWRQDSRPLNR
jgi:predicted O-methyltransferase YrrM